MNMEKFEKMTGRELVAYADKLCVKVNANKERTGLKESKKTAIDKIIKYEEKHQHVEKKEVKSSRIDDILPSVFDALSNYITKTYKSNRNYIIVRTAHEKSKRIGEVDVLRNKITIYIKADISELPNGITCKGLTNKALGYCYHVSYDGDFIQNMMYLVDYQKGLL